MDHSIFYDGLKQKLENPAIVSCRIYLKIRLYSA